MNAKCRDQLGNNTVVMKEPVKYAIVMLFWLLDVA
jgi:hypothetical protein